MKILVLGADGYIGWPLCLRLESLGHEVHGFDNYVRRLRVKEVGSNSAIPIAEPDIRNNIFEIRSGSLKYLYELDGYDAIVHLAEQPSAPYSMQNVRFACETVNQNVMGTMNLLYLMKEQNPDAHLVKLGTMGEYGTPSCDIPEGFIEDGPMKGLPFPKQAGSFYHLSKVFDTQCIEFACRTWGLRSTDIMQGIVFGTRTKELNHPDKMTRFDYDQYFGTVINRFCAQAVAEVPLTVYGGGGQTRGFLPLKDSIECLVLAIENPPVSGEYRVFNQFGKIYSVTALAAYIERACRNLGMMARTKAIDNPRIEAEMHHYEPRCEKLRMLGYNPNWEIWEEMEAIIEDLIPYKYHINKKVIYPTTTWK